MTTPALLTDHDRLRALLPTRRCSGTSGWASDAIRMATEAVEHYDGRNLDNRQKIHKFFREVTPDLYAGCHDVAGAGVVLLALIEGSA